MIILKCVSERSKLRIKFHSYVDEEGRRYENVYNHNYNCQFPKDIRVDGRYYSIADSDLTLVDSGSRQPFYKVKKSSTGIHVMTVDEIRTILNIVVVRRNTTTVTPALAAPSTVYEISECVICFDNSSNVTFVPCGHLCCCSNCYSTMKSMRQRSCPLCRTTITNSIEA